MAATLDADLHAHILRADEANFAYFAERAKLPGAVIFSVPRAPMPEFEVAFIGSVQPGAAGSTLRAIERHFRRRARIPRIRLSPVSRPHDWPTRLRSEGYVEIGDSPAYFLVPPEAPLRPPPDVRVVRATSPEDAVRFAEMQIAGFALPQTDLAWERELALRHLSAGTHQFYLAALDGRFVAAARSVRASPGLCALAALATIPEARGRGAATALLAHIATTARSRGDETVFGTTLPGSVAAGLYQRLGFTTLFCTRTFVRLC